MKKRQFIKQKHKNRLNNDRMSDIPNKKHIFSKNTCEINCEICRRKEEMN